MTEKNNEPTQHQSQWQKSIDEIQKRLTKLQEYQQAQQLYLEGKISEQKFSDLEEEAFNIFPEIMKLAYLAEVETIIEVHRTHEVPDYLGNLIAYMVSGEEI